MNEEDKLAIYQAADGSIKLPVDAKSETVWTTQEQIAGIFGIDRTRVTRHLNNITKGWRSRDKK